MTQQITLPTALPAAALAPFYRHDDTPLGPAWLAAAWSELGQRERAGSGANARIVAFYRDAGHPGIRGDEIAWCAAFAGAILARSGYAPTGSLLARSYLDWGDAISELRFGAIAVFSRGADSGAGHVGFLIGAVGDTLVILGGNQSDAVSVAVFPASRLLGLRWPNAIGSTIARSDSTQRPRPMPLAFDDALAHVLDMEGGYTDDPEDPGGPTNKGLTLADLTRHRGIALTSSNRNALIAELRAISDTDVRSIYATAYWRRSGCPALPPWLALFHFDTAVNMGTGTAIRMLQTALGVEIDGEVGPVTTAAAATADPVPLLDAYAGLRRQRYRSLSTFPRFGRGWLNRTSRTLDRARTLATLSPPHTRTTSMPSTTPPSSPSTSDELALPKWWGNSTTIWGALITGLAAVLPAIAPAVGLDIPREAVTESAEQIGAIVQAATGLAGTIITILGRIRATRPIARREIKLMI
ncbi:MAG: TIGR02594 family protein [Hyphomicrobiaceae bacterium]|nr:TIGR02594 family protein [Hyphomicrobiaceae bacterium]